MIEAFWQIPTAWRARLIDAALILFLAVIFLSVARAETYRTTNFVVTATSAQVAQEMAETAELCRAELAQLWLGKSLPAWRKACPIQVKVGEKLSPGGETSFVFQDGEVFGWEMKVQGSRARLLDSVIPHEVTHMIFASHFRQPLPRWFDEGAATCMEDISEKSNYHAMLRRFLNANVQRGLPFNRMVSMMQYPSDALPLYAQSYTVVEFLLERGTHQDFVRFGEIALRANNWTHAAREVYKLENLGEMQTAWVDWIAVRGAPNAIVATANAPIASNFASNLEENSVYARMMEDPRTLQPITDSACRVIR